MKLLVILIGWVCFCDCLLVGRRPGDVVKCGWSDEGTNNFKDHPNFKYVDFRSICGLGNVPYRWNVLLIQRNSTGKKVQYCGGSVISGKTILTSAKCVTTKDQNTLEAKLKFHNNGKTTLYNFGSNEFKVVKHSDYNEVTHENDIALIILNEYLNPFHPLCLPFYDELIKKKLTDLEIAGWGVTETGFRSEHLLIGNVRHYSHEDCKKSYNITEKQMCTFDENGGACDGDEGAPLKGMERGQYFLYGITSYFDKPCGEHPTVYTKVTEYLDWILDNLEDTLNLDLELDLDLDLDLDLEF